MPRPRSAPPLVAVYPMALGAMMPWPILMFIAVLAFDSLDKWWEVAFLFGGLTSLAMIPLAMFIDVPNAVYAIVMILVWFITLLAAPPLIRSQWKSRTAAFATIIGLGVFSMMQALLGELPERWFRMPSFT